jgi:TetR/AcrR family transcriptional regulator, transcriptional repressor for nem operon
MGSAEKTTATRILDAAEQLAQTSGFNGFSYADIAAKVKVRKPSLHHHFPTKTDLGVALIERYHQAFFRTLRELEAEVADPYERLQRYVAIYRAVLTKDRLCLCGMFAAEVSTLPKPMRTRVSRFFADNETWVAALLEQGRKAKALHFDDDAIAVAQKIVCTLEGAMLVARSRSGIALFDTVTENLLRDLSMS